MDDSETGKDSNDNVMATFHTKQEQYAVPGVSISIPASLDVNGLNEIINKFLKQAGREEDVEFDFLLNGQFVNLPLAELLEEKEISKEALLELEYLERRPPPEPQDSLQHDDWVAAVHSCGEWLLTGCYDNSVHIWDTAGVMAGRGEGAHRLTLQAHKAAVKAVTWLPQEDENTSRFITGSMDQSVMLWSWQHNSKTPECLTEYRGHTQSVECIALDASGRKFATGSWDTQLKIWSTAVDDGSNDDEPEIKKRRKEGKKVKKASPLMTLAGHTENVGGVVWTGEKEVVTSSWDHTLRIWDVEIGGMLSQINGNVAYFSLSWSPVNRMIVASCADRHVRLYDPRSSAGTVVKEKFTSHMKWVSSVKWSPKEEHLFISGGHDNLLKLWDVRSPTAPLYDLSGHEDKVLAVDWSQPNQLVSGGADCAVKVFAHEIGGQRSS